MGRWLDRVENSANAPDSIPTEPTQPGFVSSVGTPTGGIPQNRGGSVSSVGTPTGAFPEIEPEELPDTRGDWLEWIAGQVPLVPGDREYVWARLATLPAQAVERVARRYVETWQTTADRALAEMSPDNRAWWAACEQKDAPWPIGPTNRGRDAANRTLLALVEPGSWRHRHTHRKP